MKVKCIDNKIDEWELPDRILGKIIIGEIYDVDYEFTAVSGILSEEMYYLKDKGPFKKSRFVLI